MGLADAGSGASAGPRRVLHIVTRLIVGGAQRNTLESAWGVDPRRFRSAVLCGPETGPEGSLHDEARARGVDLTVEPTLRRAVRPWHDARALARLERHVRAGRFDVVHTHSSKAGLLGRLAACRAGVPLVVHTVHGWSFHAQQPAWERALYVRLERRAARWCHRLVAVSERDVRKGLSAGIGAADDYRVIRSAVDLSRFRPDAEARTRARLAWGVPEGAPVVGSVMRLSPQKDPLGFVEAAAGVARVHPQARFVVVGDGPLRAAAEARAAARGLAARFLWLGIRADVARLLPGFDAFLLTSRWEGLPRTLVEAMACEVAVVATRVDGSAELIEAGRTGLLVPPAQPEAAARAVAELLDAPERRRALACAAAGRVRDEFSLLRMSAELEALYEGKPPLRGPGPHGS